MLSIVATVVLAWLVLRRMATAMAMPEMAGMPMPPTPWTIGDLSLRLAMWVVMMAGMMLPSAMPMILLFRRVAGRQSHPAARVALFTSAYILVWSGFSLLATLLQQALEHLALSSPMAMQASPGIGALILIGAGLYQWMPAKRACLDQCRSPLSFLLRYPLTHWRDAWRLGLAHGLYCVGCCWALMCVLFAVGVMNLLWVAALSVFVLLEKTLPGIWLPRLSGALLISWGTWALWRALPSGLLS